MLMEHINGIMLKIKPGLLCIFTHSYSYEMVINYLLNLKQRTTPELYNETVNFYNLINPRGDQDVESLRRNSLENIRSERKIEDIGNSTEAKNILSEN